MATYGNNNILKSKIQKGSTTPNLESESVTTTNKKWEEQGENVDQNEEWQKQKEALEYSVAMTQIKALSRVQLHERPTTKRCAAADGASLATSTTVAFNHRPQNMAK